MLIDSIQTIGAFLLAGEAGSTSAGSDVDLLGGLGDGGFAGGSVSLTGGDGGMAGGGFGGDVLLTGGSAGVGSGGDGGSVILLGGAPDGAGAPGGITASSPVLATSTPVGITCAPGAGLELVPIPKGTLPGALGAGLAGAPPGTLFVIVDDATGPTPFVLIIVDGTTTYVRTDTYAVVT